MENPIEIRSKMASLSRALLLLTSDRKGFQASLKSSLRVGMGVYQAGGRVSKVWSPNPGEIGLIAHIPKGTVAYSCLPDGTVRFDPVNG